jgi:LmbE family N-acetylglucosaminyl deacetylase
MSNQTLLVILAHPDDESFPIGGTLAKYAAEGVRGCWLPPRAVRPVFLV